MPGRSGPEEAHREEDQLARHGELRAGDLAEDRPPALARDLDPHGLERRRRARARRRGSASSRRRRRARRPPRGPRRPGRRSGTGATGCRARAGPAAAAGSPSGGPSARPGGAPCPGSPRPCRRRRGSPRACPRARDEVGVREPSPSQRRFWSGRNSIAKWMPLELAAGDGQVARPGTRRPARSSASCSWRRRSGSTSTPTWALVTNSHALGPHLVEAPVERALLHLELGDPVAEEPADPVGALEHGDLVPGAAELLRRRRARPGPEPTTATRFPVRTAGGSGAIQPSANARSTIASSIGLIVTGSSLMPRTHEPSHGAGHSVPVNSGKLFVAWSRSMASPPVVPVDEVVPVGDEVPERTPLMAERDAAVHAPGRLLLELRHRPGEHDLPPVAQALGDRPVGLLVARELEEAGDLAHPASREPLP